jgi:hypothetical protein
LPADTSEKGLATLIADVVSGTNGVRAAADSPGLEEVEA